MRSRRTHLNLTPDADDSSAHCQYKVELFTPLHFRLDKITFEIKVKVAAKAYKIQSD